MSFQVVPVWRQVTPALEQELADAKSYITGSLPLSLTSTGGIASLMMGLELDDLPTTYMDTYPDRIKAVTVADVQRIAQRLFNPDSLTVIMVGDPAKTKPTRVIDKLPNAE